MAGGGNDFVVIDNRSARVADAVELTKRICTAHLSVGADGLILVETSTSADFRMRYFNNDGSGGEFCANGTRCAARYAVLHGIAPMKMAIETDVGIVGAEVSGGTVTLSLPSPHGFRAERPLRIGDRVVRGSSIVMGVPHYVLFEPNDLWTQDIVPLRLLPVVSTLYQGYPEPPTAWTLHNIFTTSLKQLAPAPAFAATVELGRLFGLTTSD